MKLFINLSDFQKYKDVSENIDEDRINTYILDSQFIDIRGFLGAELFGAMQLNFNVGTGKFTDPRFIDLWEGVGNYFGLKPALVEYSYARLLDNIQLNVTRAGVRKFSAEESEEVEQDQINSKVASARSMAIAYRDDAKTFLDKNHSTFPAWVKETTRNTSLNFFKV